jgi:hypothetical protein
VPSFVTQGFIERNTKPEAMEEYLDNHQGLNVDGSGSGITCGANETDAIGRRQEGRCGRAVIEASLSSLRDVFGCDIGRFRFQPPRSS